jgi:chromosome segregation ATPase
MYSDSKYQKIMFEINRWEELKGTKKPGLRRVSTNIEELPEENCAQAAEIDLLLGEKEDLLLIVAQLEDDLRMRGLDPRQVENKIARLEAEKEQLKARLKTKEVNWNKLDEKWTAAKRFMDEAI